MKLPFERTPRNALTVSAKRTQKRRFFARKAEIIPDDGYGNRLKLAAKRPERRLYAWRKLTARIRNPIAITNLVGETCAIRATEKLEIRQFSRDGRRLLTRSTAY